LEALTGWPGVPAVEIERSETEAGREGDEGEEEEEEGGGRRREEAEENKRSSFERWGAECSTTREAGGR